MSANGFESVKEFLLAAAHVGRLRPGKRVPSVRRMAQLMQLDRKTVHRAYLKLTAEGFLAARPSSGTFLAETAARTPARYGTAEMLEAVRNSLDEAAARGLPAETFARVLLTIASRGLRGMPVAIAECNHEQIGLIGRELRMALGIEPLALDIDAPRAEQDSVLRRSAAVVATNCHRDDVLDLAAPLGLPVSFVAQNQHFADAFVARAHRGAVLLVVGDARFERGFRRLLAMLGVAGEVMARMRVVDVRGADAAMRAVPAGSAIYVSPLVPAGHVRVPGVHRTIEPAAYVDADSVRRVELELADRALQIGFTPTRLLQAATHQEHPERVRIG